MSGGPPAQPLAPGNYDKAWNDPPLFSYSASSAPPTGGGRLLTKRVGFPSSHPPPPGLDPTAPPMLHDAGAKPPPSSLPPPPPTAHLSTPSSPNSTAGCAPDAPTNISVEETVATYEELMKTYLPPEKYQSINTKLSVMFSAWKEGGLNSRLQVLVAEVGSKLSSKDLGGAEASYVVLSADYGGEIGAQWVLAIRHIITAVREEHSETVGQRGGVTTPL